MTIALNAEDRFGTFLATGITGMYLFHVLVNVGMTIGITPVIGIPLPLLSYGGSSLWAFTVLIFIFIALYREEKKYY